MPEEFLMKYPNTPEKPVSLILTGCREIAENLKISAISDFFIEDISESLGTHADIAAHHLGGKKIVVTKSAPALIKALRAFDVIETKRLEPSYPGNSKLNFARIGDYIIGCFKNIDPALETLCGGLKKINVRQGYAKCGIAVVSKTAAITEDHSIFKELSRAGLDVLLIRKGGVALTGFDYGFIGGASGLIAPDILVFSGDIKSHADFHDIRAFCKNHGVFLEAAKSGPLSDVGGIIPLAY